MNVPLPIVVYFASVLALAMYVLWKEEQTVHRLERMNAKALKTICELQDALDQAHSIARRVEEEEALKEMVAKL